MKKITLTLFLAAICLSLFAQHIMEVIPPDTRGSGAIALEHRNTGYLPHFNSLDIYDGNSLTVVPLPMVDGVQLYFDRDILVYGDEVYLTMRNGPYRQYIARFRDGVFSLARLPAVEASNIVVFNGKMYMVAFDDDTYKLVSYDGSTFRNVITFPHTASYQIRATSNYLYVTERRHGPWGRPDEFYLTRYNGVSSTSFRFPDDAGWLDEVFELSRSGESYFVTSNTVIYSDGGTLFELFHRDPIDVDITGEVLWRNQLYFRTSNGRFQPTEFHRCSGATIATIEPPSGTTFLYPNLWTDDNVVVYRDALYVPVTAGGVPSAYRYDGSGWESVFSPGTTSTNLEIRERRGKLVFFQRNFSEFAYEYNGFGFESFSIPPGADFFGEYLLATRCYYLWLAAIDRPDLGGFNFILMKETFDSLCVAPGSSSVIPGHIAKYDRLIIGNHAPERDWCWTGIDVDWEVPICITPPCPLPQMQTRLTDKSGKTVWEKVFDKPFSSSIPFNDVEPYALSIDVESDKKFHNVLLLDKELVNNGVEDLSLDFYPKDGYFFLDVETEMIQQVGLTMTLRNANGESLWDKKFTAPFHDVIYDRVDKAGAYLQFSLQGEAKSGVSYYPNPFNGKLSITIAKGSDPVSVSIMNLNGKMIMQKQFDDAGEHTIEMNSEKSGLYILTIKEGGNSRRELIELKD